jgi:hypothetical protein
MGYNTFMLRDYHMVIYMVYVGLDHLSDLSAAK